MIVRRTEKHPVLSLIISARGLVFWNPLHVWVNLAVSSNTTVWVWAKGGGGRKHWNCDIKVIHFSWKCVLVRWWWGEGAAVAAVKPQPGAGAAVWDTMSSVSLSVRGERGSCSTDPMITGVFVCSVRALKKCFTSPGERCVFKSKQVLKVFPFLIVNKWNILYSEICFGSTKAREGVHVLTACTAELLYCVYKKKTLK